MAFGIDDIMLAIIGGTTSAGVGSLLGGLTGSQGGDSGDERLIFQRPDANPLQSGLTADALFALGLPFFSTQFQASPLEQAIAEINEHPGLSTKQKRRAEAGLRDYVENDSRGMTSGMWKEMHRAAGITGLGGFRSLDNLRSEQQKFTVREQKFQAETAALQDQIRRDRFKAAGVLSGSGTPEALDAAIAQVRKVRDAEMIEHANRFGFNPAAGLRSDAQNLGTLQEALGLIGARQSIASTSLTGSPSAAGALQLIQSGRGALSGQNQALLGSAGLGLGQSENLGAGIAGAGNALADMFLLLAGDAQQKRQLSSGQLQEGLGTPYRNAAPYRGPFDHL